MPRRVVTGNNATGRSYVVSDEIVDEVIVWDTAGRSDPFGGGPVPRQPTSIPVLEPPRGGTKCFRVTMPPWKIAKPMLASNPVAGMDSEGFHRTETIDYVMMIDGEITCLLDEGEVTLRAGDLLIQRNTNHAWQVRADQPANYWAVMVSANM